MRQVAESIQELYPQANGDFDKQVITLRKGIDYVEDQMKVPEDGRVAVTITTLGTGDGTKSAGEAIGESGSGKTELGNFMFGPDQHVDIQPDDVADTLFGFTNPINAKEHIPGKLVGLKGENMNMFLNELGNIANDRPLLALWDRADIKDAAVYTTSNFPNGKNSVHDHSDALKSRLAFQILLGDHDRSSLVEIQDGNADREKDFSQVPILPGVTVRRQMHAEIAKRYPQGNERAKAIGTYVVDLLDLLNSSGLTSVIQPSDARIGQAFYTVARSRMLVDRVPYGTPVAPEYLAQVASLVLAGKVELSHNARNKFVETIGRRPSEIEKAITVRRVIARVAFSNLFSKEALPMTDIGRMTELSVNKYSYANPSAVGTDGTGTRIDVDQIAFSKPESNAASKVTTKETRNVRRSILKRRG